MSVFFITGIDTGCGKTFATGLIARSLMEVGVNVITQKLIQTGCTGISEDILEHRKLMGCELFWEDLKGITCPYVFSYAASPHLAAELDHAIIETKVLANATERLTEKFDMVLLEGAGGLHVPIHADFLTIDYIKMQDYPVILVASSKLGSINHTLLSLESCFFHKIHLFALLYNRLPGNDPIIADNTLQQINKARLRYFPKSKLAEIGSEDFSHKALSSLFDGIY